MFVKICGLRTPDDVAVAVEAGADAIGFVLAESVRQVQPEQIADLVAPVPDHVLTVGVFVETDPGVVRAQAERAGVQAIQLHGNHPMEVFEALRDSGFRLIRATSARRLVELSPDGYTVGEYGEDLLLLDSPVPGSGHTWSPDDAPVEVSGPWLLAGGLDPDNVADAIRALKPTGVDVSSGVESTRGVKDHAKIVDFLRAVPRSAEDLHRLRGS